ncbi:serine hydrolase, partial [Streptococcus salivarius]|nr:serine hydrolase [Streptococcus salivarius]
KKINSNKSAYTSVKITQLATTPTAQYAKIENSGWVRADYLSDTDNRIEKVQEILTSRYNQADFSIYVKQLNTGKTAG